MEVQSWTAARIRGWMTYFQVVNDLEKESMDRAKNQASSKAFHESIHKTKPQG